MSKAAKVIALMASVWFGLSLAGCDSYRNNPNWYEATCPHCGHHDYWMVVGEDGLRSHEGRAKCPTCAQVFQAWSTPNASRQGRPVTSSAQAEYRAALQEYNTALQELNTVSIANDLYNLPFPLTSKTDVAIQFLGQLGTGAGRADAQRRVEVARQRLEGARARLVAEAQVAPVDVNSRQPSNSDGTRHFDGNLSDGSHYVGGVLAGKCHGFGTRTCSNGSKYAGEWVNGEAQGYGTWTLANGNKYSGEFQAGKEHGHGSLTLANGNKYVGQFQDGEPHGQGTLTLTDGRTYIGGFKVGKFEGHGTFSALDGSQMMGQFQGGKLNGRGSSYNAESGEKYVGEFRDGQYEGQGIVTFRDGSQYVGELRGGKYHGFGKLTQADGAVKEGFWQENVFKGRLVDE